MAELLEVLNQFNVKNRDSYVELIPLESKIFLEAAEFGLAVLQLLI